MTSSAATSELRYSPAVRPRPRLLVFDWDGTLADSQAKIVFCFRRALADVGAPQLPERQLTAVIGLALLEAIQALFPEADEAFHLRLVEAYRERWLAPEAPAVALFEGAVATLGTLADRGYLLGVATGKSRRGLDRELDELGLRSMFVATRCADEARSKPHPQMLLELLACRELAPEEALLVGDSVHDLRMAAAARVPAVAVEYGACAREELLAQRPLACLSRIDELLDFVA